MIFLGSTMCLMNIVELTHSFNKYLLSTSFSASKLLSTWNTELKEVDKVPIPLESTKSRWAGGLSIRKISPHLHQLRLPLAGSLFSICIHIPTQLIHEPSLASSLLCQLVIRNTPHVAAGLIRGRGAMSQ